MDIVVAKFGGTSMGTAASVRAVAEIVAADQNRRVVVVSALSGVTNLLLRMAELASRGQSYADELAQLHSRHLEMIADLKINPNIQNYFDDLDNFLKGVDMVRELTGRSRDYILSFGERLSSEILAAFMAPHHPVQRVDAKDIIKTDNVFSGAAPLMDKTKQAADAVLLPILAQGKIAVITGFIGGNDKGEYTTFTRGGSDYSAAILANVLDAKSLEIWTDVDGIMNADPRIISGARTIPQMAYKEAAELSYFGAKVLHPKTIEPAVQKNIPVKVLNTFNPAHSGTTISNGTDNTIKSVTYKKGSYIITLYSTQMLDARGFMAMIFSIFQKHGSAVDVVTTSEVCVSVTMDEKPPDALIAELRGFAEVEVRGNNAVLCLVGEGINQTNGIPAKLFSALSDCPIKMISQGASPRNITLVIDEDSVLAVIPNIYKTFFNQ